MINHKSVTDKKTDEQTPVLTLEEYADNFIEMCNDSLGRKVFGRGRLQSEYNAIFGIAERQNQVEELRGYLAFNGIDLTQFETPKRDTESRHPAAYGGY